MPVSGCSSARAKGAEEFTAPPTSLTGQHCLPVPRPVSAERSSSKVPEQLKVQTGLQYRGETNDAFNFLPFYPLDPPIPVLDHPSGWTATVTGKTAIPITCNMHMDCS